MEIKNKNAIPQLPCGEFCGGNCSGPNSCIYWNPHVRDNNGRQYCSYYDTYYYPNERNGCLSKQD